MGIREIVDKAVELKTEATKLDNLKQDKINALNRMREIDTALVPQQSKVDRLVAELKNLMP